MHARARWAQVWAKYAEAAKLLLVAGEEEGPHGPQPRGKVAAAAAAAAAAAL